ncbi:MAG: CHAT domain-containing protein (plasmid) [Leptolyngbya sp. BL-A-14]
MLRTYNRAILFLLLLCPGPLVALRVTATEPFPSLEARLVAKKTEVIELTARKSQQLQSNLPTKLKWWQKSSKTYGVESWAGEKEGLKQVFKRKFLVAQATSEQDAWRLLQVGSQLIDEGKYLEALQLLDTAKDIFVSYGNVSGEAATLISLGLACVEVKSCNQTLSYFGRADNILERLGSSYKDYYYSLTLINKGIGKLYKKEGDLDKAKKYYVIAISFAKQVVGEQRLYELADINSKLGYVSNDLDDYDSSIKYFQEALGFAKRMSKEWEAYVKYSLAWACNRKDRYDEALSYAQESLEIHKQENNLSGQSSTEDILGSIYDNLGSYDKAEQHYLQSLKIHERVCLENVNSCDFYGEAITRSNLGFLYNNLNEFEKARATLEKAWKTCSQPDICDDEFKGKILSNLAATYYGLKLYTEAIKYAEQAIKIKPNGDPQGLSRVLWQLGVFYQATGSIDQSLEKYQRSLVLFKSINDKKGEALALSKIGSLFAAGRQEPLAIIFYKESVRVTEKIRQDNRKLSIEDQKSYAQSIASTYRSLADLLLKQDRVLEAQQVLDLLKVQELKDYLQTVRSSDQPLYELPLEHKILEKYKALQFSVIQLGQELEKLGNIPQANRTAAQEKRIGELVKINEDLNGQFNNFIDHDLDLKAWLDQLTPAIIRQTIDLSSLDGYRENLRQLNAVLLYPLVLEDRLELIIITPDSPPLRRPVPVKRVELNNAISQFRRELRDSESDPKPTAQKLYNWLIKPIEKDLQQAKPQTILYAPDGQLRYIPLQALHDGQQWLVQRYRVNNITAKSIDKLTAQPTSQPHILAGAFAHGERTFKVGRSSIDLKGLSFAGKEVETLVAQLPNTTKLLDDTFSRDNITSQMNQYNIVHLATHASFVPGEATDSFIAFGNGDSATLKDIKKWTVNHVDLFVLSACETALGGKFGNGEEILGLGYQFQERGVKAVIASLWKVDDGGTQALMGSFYTNLKQGNITKSEALRQAQITLININQPSQRGNISSNGELTQGLSPDIAKRLNHPHYWAPFILIGNGF